MLSLTWAAMLKLVLEAANSIDGIITSERIANGFDNNPVQFT